MYWTYDAAVCVCGGGGGEGLTTLIPHEIAVLIMIPIVTKASWANVTLS